jgi:hypothetical protein
MPEPNDSAKTREVIRDVLSRGYAYSTYEIQGYLQITLGRMISESAVSARIRDLRKPQFGGYTVISRPRHGCTAWEYQILVNQQDKEAA